MNLACTIVTTIKNYTFGPFENKKAFLKFRYGFFVDTGFASTTIESLLHVNIKWRFRPVTSLNRINNHDDTETCRQNGNKLNH